MNLRHTSIVWQTMAQIMGASELRSVVKHNIYTLGGSEAKNARLFIISPICLFLPHLKSLSRPLWVRNLQSGL